MLARLMESQLWCPPASSVCGGLIKGIMASASSPVWEKASPLALALMLDNLVPPYMSLVPFELLLQCWSSAGVSQSPCAGPLEELPGTSGVLHLTQPQSPLVFTVRCYGDSSFWP